MEDDSVTDSKGRVLVCKRLSRREVMRFMRQWGTACNVESWFSLALVCASVQSVDGAPLPPPVTADRVEATADILGQEGTDAVAEWYQSLPAPDLAADRQAAKN